MGIVVRRVDSRSGMRAFLELPRRVYRNDPHWVPQIDTEVRRILDDRRNPYFRSASLALFLAERDGRASARASVVLNHAYRSSSGGPDALMGFFESDGDAEAVQELFDTCEGWARSRGAASLVGPFHPHHYSEVGVQLSGWETPPSFFQTHHLPSYRGLLELAGFVLEKRLQTRRNRDIRSFLGSSVDAPSASNELVSRTLDGRRLSEELDRVRYVLNDAFADNPYFLPLSAEEYAYSSRSLSLVTRPDLNVIVEHCGEPVGALQCVLDINPLLRPMRSGRPGPVSAVRFFGGRRHVRRLIVFSVGIRRQWQRSRVHCLLFNALRRMASHYDELETTWMSPDNPLALMAAERFGMMPDKEFGVFRRTWNGRRLTGD